MIKTIITNLVTVRNYLIYKKFDYLSKINSSRFRVDVEANFVVSIASYPKRDHLLPAVFEALSYQTVRPRKWLLVLSEEDYPNQKLPKHLMKLSDKGVEILLIKNNPYAVKKLLPVLNQYPDYDVITLDDDIIYHRALLKRLVDYAHENKNSIIGYVGKALLKKGKSLHFYFREKRPANLLTPSAQVYLIGWGGIYYPSKSLSKKVLDMEAVQRIVPGRGSDIWFWAAAHSSKINQICLGVPDEYNLGIPIPQNNQTSPKDRPGNDVLLDRFQMAIDFFEIREKLLATLPNKE